MAGNRILVNRAVETSCAPTLFDAVSGGRTGRFNLTTPGREHVTSLRLSPDGSGWPSFTM